MSLQEAYQLHKAGQLDAAEVAYGQLLDEQPDRAEVLHLLGVLKAQSGRPGEAVELIGRAIDGAPEEAKFHLNLGHALRALQRIPEAEQAYRQALDLSADHGEALAALGDLLLSDGRAEAAVAPLSRALAQAPDNARLTLALGLAHLRTGWAQMTHGRFDQAEPQLRRAIVLAPELAGRAYGHLAQIKRFQPGDPDIAAMEGLVAAADGAAEDAIRLDFALAKAYDDLDDTARAFEHWARGNANRRQSQPYQIETTRAACRLMKETFSAEFMAPDPAAGCPSGLPILIVGMPRSGTSLVEQILASHPAVAGGGERRDLEQVGQAFLARFGAERPSPEQIRATEPADWRALGEDYVARLGAVAGPAERVTDKEPGNVMRLALIRKALPQARVIHVLRDPMDTCFSCYRQLFRRGSAFATDLADLGAHYQVYREMMDHWQATMGDQILSLQYEALVSQPEAEIRRLLDFCGLDWDPACLAFHETGRPVETFSLAQVRQPLSPAAIGRWRRYETQLQPLAEALGPYGPA